MDQKLLRSDFWIESPSEDVERREKSTAPIDEIELLLDMNTPIDASHEAERENGY